MTDAVREYEKHRGEVYASPFGSMVQTEAADAAIAELQDKLDRAQEYARIEVKRKNEAVERECAAIERAEKAEAEAARLRCCGNCEHRDEETLDYCGSYFVCLTEFKPKTNMRHMEVDCEDHCHFAPSRWQRREG